MNFGEFQTEADVVKMDTGTNLAAHRVRALIEILGRDGATEAIEHLNI
jgi:predicted P-loop ATPase